MPSHGKRLIKLSKTKSHREAMLANMATSLFQSGAIQTTLAKAKVLRPYAERLVTYAKKGDLNSQRLMFDVLRDRDVVKKVVKEIAPQLADRNGGYTRILRIAKKRLGDGADLAFIQLLIERPKVEKLKEGDKKKAKEKNKEAEAASK
ncbi:MAG: 50S ribosomal protein L17 [candidate division Zixibacteria bacterium]|nr:50S ribosomal protein L17 [candidate division Zixibacteria bacterium]